MTATDPENHGNAQALSLAHACLVVGAVSAYADVAGKRKDTARAILVSDYMGEGDRHVIRDPRDGRTKLGTVTITDPEPVAEVHDREAFLDYLGTAHPEAISWGCAIRPGAMDEVLALVAQHRPDLLAEPRRTCAEWAFSAALKAAESGEDTPPGVTVRTKPGHAVVRPAAGALDAYRELVAQGHVDPLAELPAGGAG